MEIQKELTPELAQKIYRSVQMKMLGDKLAKEGTLHNLKQLKAQSETAEGTNRET